MKNKQILQQPLLTSQVYLICLLRKIFNYIQSVNYGQHALIEFIG